MNPHLHLLSKRLTRVGAIARVLLIILALYVVAPPAVAVDDCGGETHSCSCAAHTPCICCECGNCVWWAWHEACCYWNRALEWCTDATTWDNYAISNGYPVGTEPQNGSIFVCEASSVCSGWGHVGWIVTAYPDGSFDSTEMACGGWCGVQSRTRPAGFAESYIYDPSGTPVEVDDAEYVSETIPDGTHFNPGEAFTKRWTLRNAGNTTWTRTGNYVLAHDGDELFSADTQSLLPDGVSVAPGANYDWDVAMIAPMTPGTYRGYWIMDHVGDGRFGDRVWVEIVVDDVPVDVTEPTPDPVPDPTPDATTDPTEDVIPDLQPDLEPDPADDPIQDIPEDTAPGDLPPTQDTDSEGPVGILGAQGGCSCMLALW